MLLRCYFLPIPSPLLPRGLGQHPVLRWEQGHLEFPPRENAALPCPRGTSFFGPQCAQVLVTCGGDSRRREGEGGACQMMLAGCLQLLPTGDGSLGRADGGVHGTARHLGMLLPRRPGLSKRTSQKEGKPHSIRGAQQQHPQGCANGERQGPRS